MAKKKLCGDQWISLWQHDSGTLTVWMGDGVTIVPVNKDNQVLLISEPSVAYDGLRSLLLPSGALEEGEDPEDCANRELQEELGLKGNRVDTVGLIYASIKYVEEKFHIVMVRDLEESILPGDEPEDWIEMQEPVNLSDIETLIAEGRLLNSSTIAALFMARSFLEKEQQNSQ